IEPGAPAKPSGQSTEDARTRDERLKLAKASRDAGERKVAKREPTRLDQSTEQGRASEDDACSRDNEKLARLRGSLALAWGREDLKRLQESTTCDRVRSDVVALQGELAPPEARQQHAPPEARQQRAAINEGEAAGGTREQQSRPPASTEQGR